MRCLRELPDGQLVLIDGHLRRDTMPEAVVPVLVLDLDEDEADKLLLARPVGGHGGVGRRANQGASADCAN
jgi:hypothetical protein